MGDGRCARASVVVDVVVVDGREASRALCRPLAYTHKSSRITTLASDAVVRARHPQVAVVRANRRATRRARAMGAIARELVHARSYSRAVDAERARARRRPSVGDAMGAIARELVHARSYSRAVDAERARTTVRVRPTSSTSSASD